MIARIKTFHPLEENAALIYVNTQGSYLQIQMYQSQGAMEEIMWYDRDSAFQEVTLEEYRDGVTTVISHGRSIS